MGFLYEHEKHQHATATYLIPKDDEMLKPFPDGIGVMTFVFLRESFTTKFLDGMMVNYIRKFFEENDWKTSKIFLHSTNKEKTRRRNKLSEKIPCPNIHNLMWATLVSYGDVCELIPPDNPLWEVWEKQEIQRTVNALYGED